MKVWAIEGVVDRSWGTMPQEECWWEVCSSEGIELAVRMRRRMEYCRHVAGDRVWVFFDRHPVYRFSKFRCLARQLSFCGDATKLQRPLRAVPLISI